jgi:hypothetical protein
LIAQFGLCHRLTHKSHRLATCRWLDSLGRSHTNPSPESKTSSAPSRSYAAD